MGGDDPPQPGPALDDQYQERLADLAQSSVIAPRLGTHMRHDDAGYELTRVLDLDMQSGIPVGTGMNGAVRFPHVLGDPRGSIGNPAAVRVGPAATA
jgi:hypothetical protein